MFVFSGVGDALPKRYTNRIFEGHDLPSCKAVLEPFNSKRSLPVLKWASESEYFLSFRFFFAHRYSPRAIT